MSSSNKKCQFFGNWKFLTLILAPLILIPLLVIEDTDTIPIKGGVRSATKYKCAYVIILMCIYWAIEALPLAITALLPIVLFPLLGVQDTSSVSANYMKEITMFFMGGIMIALAVESSNLHKRVALKVVTIVGTSPIRLMLGVMLTTMLLSMWISNTATTTMMVPIVLAILEELHKGTPKGDFSKNLPPFKKILGAENEGFVPDEGAEGKDKDNEDNNKVKKKETVIGVDSNKRFGLAERTDSVNTIEEPPQFDGGMGNKLTTFHKYIIATDPVEDEENLKKLKNILFTVILTGANIGGVFWPYGAATSSMVLYYATKGASPPPSDDPLNSTSNATTSILSSRCKEDVDHVNSNSYNKMKQMYFFSVAFSANLGGTGTLNGSATNLILKEFLNEVNVGQDGKYVDLTFATWMCYNVPAMLLNTLIAWVYLIIVFYGFPAFLRCGKKGIGFSSGDSATVNRVLREKYKALGSMKFQEIVVTILFLLAVCLWFFRQPGFIKGWSEYLPGVVIGDSTSALFIVFLLFIIPKNFDFLDGVTNKGKIQPVLEWKYVQANLPWGVVLLIGGGFALSSGAEVSGLSFWVGKQLEGLGNLPHPLILLIVMIVTASITEIASNAACASIIIPILITMSKSLGIHPLYLTLPATVSCSFAFMLPIATPPNAIIHNAGGIKILKMARVGIFLNISSVLVLFLVNITIGNLIFDYDNYTYS